jgi:hypothetical protein
MTLTDLSEDRVQELPDQGVQAGHARQSLIRPGTGQGPPLGVHHLHIVVILSPVITYVQHHREHLRGLVHQPDAGRPTGRTSAT